MTAPNLPERWYAVAADNPTALAVLRLAEADVQETWTGPELNAQIIRRKLTDTVLPCNGATLAAYIDLRTAVERCEAAELDPDRADGWTDRELDGEVLWHLSRVLRSADPCVSCFNAADDLRGLHPDGTCSRCGDEPAAHDYGHGVHIGARCEAKGADDLARAVEALRVPVPLRPLHDLRVLSGGNG